MPRWNYQSANEFLVGRRKLHGNIASYTYLERDGDMIVMKYGQFKHGGREVVRLYLDGRVQFTKCWNGPSIRDRMNWCFNGWPVQNERGHWYLKSNGVKYSFQDGITLHPDGTVTGYDPEPFEQKIAGHLKKIRDRNAIYVVESAGGFTVGDVVFHETHGQWFKDPQGKCSRPKITNGPFRIKKIKASQTRTILWLTNLAGEIMYDKTLSGEVLKDRPQYQGVSTRYNHFRRDQFLSATSQAIRVAEAAKT